MSHVFLPSEVRLKTLAATIEEERNHALVAKEAGEAPVVERAESEESMAFRALWSGEARRDDDVLRTTQPGDALQLFADPAPPGAGPAAPATFVPASPAVTPEPSVAVADPPAAPVTESPSEKRERLRDERRALVSTLSRLTGEPHRSIHGRINRATGAATIAKATREQLEKGNRLLERDVARRR
jgi:hypothetical protein